MAITPLVLQLLPLLIDWFAFLTPILLFVADVMGNVLVASVALLVGAITWVSDSIGKFGTFFEDVWTGIKSFFGGIINSMISGFESYVNFVIRGVNFIIGALNRIQIDVPDWVTDITGMKDFGFNISKLSEISLPRVAFADGGFVNGPTNALIGEAGPEVVMPLDRFEKVMGIGQNSQRPVNYYAAPNKSFDAEQELLLAMRRVKVMA